MIAHVLKFISSVNPFKDITKWKRDDFPKVDPNLSTREKSELETYRDLQKPVQQLVCDTHEEALHTPEGITSDQLVLLQLQRIIGTNKRTASLMAVSAAESAKTSAWIFWLTLVIVFQTFALIWMTLKDGGPSKEPPTASDVAKDGNG